jgi:WD40 repeat protein
VGDDQRIVSYDLERSSVKDGIVLKRPGTGPSSQAAKGAAAARAISTHQTAKPTACLWHPQSPESKEDIFIVANDNFKFSLWSPAHSACRRTALGPTYGGPITKLLLLPAKSPGAAAQYMAYATQDKVVGLVKLPLDGNPNKAVGLIAHPAEVSNVAVSHDGRFLVTAGASDMTVNVWQVDTTVLDVAVEAGGDNLEPFLGLLDGGRDGEFFQDLRDYFCLSQLRTQGESTTAPRRVTGSTQVSEIPNLMRALGFYPSKHEIARMCDEVKYVDVVQTGNVADSVSLADFVKLYVNHRPVEGVSKADVEDAFQVLREALDADGGAGAAETGTMPWQKVLTQLRSNGEKMGDVELQTCLRALMGDEQFNLPADIGPLDFAHSVLGFEDYQEG